MSTNHAGMVAVARDGQIRIDINWLRRLVAY